MGRIVQEEEDAGLPDVVQKSLELEKQLMAHLGEPDLAPEAESKIRAMLKQLQMQRIEAESLETERSKAMALETKLRSALDDPDVSEENKAKVRRQVRQVRQGTRAFAGRNGCPSSLHMGCSKVLYAWSRQVRLILGT